MSRGETVLEGFALLEATNSRTHRQSLSVVKDLVVVGKLDMIAWVVSSTRQGERQVKLQHAARTRKPVEASGCSYEGTRGVARMRRFKRKDYHAFTYMTFLIIYYNF